MVATGPDDIDSAMDICAELTLRIARLVQERADQPSTPVYCHLFPYIGECSWSDARATLAKLPKPLIVAPLIEPGHIGVWRAATLEQSERAGLKKEIENQVGYFTEKLRVLGLAEPDVLRLETSEGEFTLTVADFHRWAREYAIDVGIGVRKGSGPRTGQLFVRPPGGGPPLGLPVI